MCIIVSTPPPKIISNPNLKIIPPPPQTQPNQVKDYANDLLSQPYQLAMSETNSLLVAPYSTRVGL